MLQEEMTSSDISTCSSSCLISCERGLCQSKYIGQDSVLLFSERCIVYIILTMHMFVGSQSFISLPSFMLVGAAVSEIRELNRNKEKKKNGYS